MFYNAPKCTRKGDRMQKQSQTEKVFAKNKKISTIYKPGRGKKNEPGWAWFEARECGKSEEQLIEFIIDFVSSIVNNPDILSIEEECHRRHIHSRTLRKWAKQCPIVEEGKDYALEIIGLRREKGMLLKKMDPKFITFLHQFLDRYTEHDDREDARKVKLASQGVTPGETKIIVVNENIKTEEPE